MAYFDVWPMVIGLFFSGHWVSLIIYTSCDNHVLVFFTVNYLEIYIFFLKKPWRVFYSKTINNVILNLSV